MEKQKPLGWKEVAYQFAPIILSSSLIAAGVSSFLYETFTKPNVQINIVPNDSTVHNSTIILSNHGWVPATHIKLVIIPPKTILEYHIFSIENFTSIKTKSNHLEVYMPRLVQGEGSITQINLLIDAKINTTYSNYSAFAVYDQGSSRGLLKATPSLAHQLSDTLMTLMSPLYLALFGFLILVSLVIYSLYFKKQAREIWLKGVKDEYDKAFTRYTKSPMTANDLIDNLKSLEHIRESIPEGYKKGYISKTMLDDLIQNIDKRMKIMMVLNRQQIGQIINELKRRIVHDSDNDENNDDENNDDENVATYYKIIRFSEKLQSQYQNHNN